MGKILSLREAINLIWETVEIGREMESGCPYLFIVGAGISAPEILTVLAKLICPNCDLLACLWNDHYTVNSTV